MDRRCRGGCSTAAAPLPAFLLFGGGPSAAVVASGNAVVADTGQSITLARTSTTTCQTSTGTSAYLASGTPCVEPLGLAVRPATVNLVSHSTSMADFTANAGGTTVTLGAGTCPDGTPNAMLVNDTATATQHRANGGVTNQGAGTYTFSIDAKPWPVNPDWFVMLTAGGFAEDAAFDLLNGTLDTNAGTPIGFSTTNKAFNITPIDGGYWHLSLTAVDTFGAGTAGLWISNRGTNVNGTPPLDGGGILFCNPQVTFTEDERPAFPNDGGATSTRQPETASFVNPVAGATMSLGASLSIDNYRADNWTQRGIIQGGWDGGPTGGDTNTWSFYLTDGGYPTFDIYDSVGALKRLTAGYVMWPGTRYVWAQVDGGGTMAIYQGVMKPNGSLTNNLLGGVVTGAGSGVLTSQPTKVFIGSQGASSNQLGGKESDVCLDSTLTGCSIGPRTTIASPIKVSSSLVAFGDSLTYDNQFQWPSWFWPQMLALDTGWSAINAGWPSTDNMDMAQTYMDGGYFYSPAHYVSVETGINDVGAIGTTALLQQLYDWFITHIASTGSTPLIMRESPALNNSGWDGTKEGRYQTFQTFVYFNAVQKFGYPYVENFDGGLEDAGSFPATLSCNDDVGQSVGGSPNLNVCVVGNNNWIHLNDAGQGLKEGEVRAVLGL